MRAVRLAAVPLLVTGVIVHLWISSKVGLGLIAIGLASHLGAVLLGRHLLRARRDGGERSAGH